MSPRAAVTAGAIVIAVLLGFAGASMWPRDASDYRDTAGKAAQGSLSAVRTAALLAGAHQAGRVTEPYESVVLADARQAVATSQETLATTEVPDSDSAKLRGQLETLLADAADLLSQGMAVLEHGDELTRLADELQSFVDGLR
jgi:hypothetical protein